MEAPKVVVHKECPIPVIVEEGYRGVQRGRTSSSTPLLKPSFYGRCFSLPCFHHSGVVGSPSSSSSSFRERLGSSRYDNRWWAPGLRVIKKIREWSELIAGPKWKTFIRRLRRKGCRTTGGTVPSSFAVPGGGGKFNYDLVNYSLNFDEGPGNHGNFDDDDGDFRRLRSLSVGYGRGDGGKIGKDAVGFGAA